MIKKLVLFFLFAFLNVYGYSQGNAGKDFWVVFMEQDTTCLPPVRIPGIPLWANDTLELYLTSPYAAKVTIEIKKEEFYGSGSDSDFTATIYLKPNQTYYFMVPPRVSYHTLHSDDITNNGVHVFSDSLITVSAINRYWTSKGATNVLPSESIPFCPEYFVTTNQTVRSNQNDEIWDCFSPFKHKPAKSPQFAIVGIADKSIVEIIPVGISSTRNNIKGIPFILTLKKGQTYGFSSTSTDLTGCIIRSRDANSKFAVFAGNRRTASGQLNSANFLCKSALDHTYEQIFPTVTWGNSYTALPYKNNPSGYYIKVVAAEDFTRVSIDGNYYTTIHQGGFFTYNVSKDTATRITADKRIEVAQFALGYGCNQHPAPKTRMGDVSQIQLMPDVQTSTSAVVNRVFKNNWWGSSASLNAPENYINVMLKTSDTAQFKINGNSVANNLWKGGNKIAGYSYAQLTIDTFSYKLTSNKGFIAYAYGYGVKEGYAFTVAGNFKTLQNNFYLNYQCVDDSTTITAVNNDSFANYSWNAGNKTGIKYGNKITVWYKDTGWYKVVMYCKHVRTNAIDSITKRIYIDMARSKGKLLINDTIICGKVDFNVFSKTFNQDYIYQWNDGHPYYYRALQAPGQYWEKVTERNGCSYIDTLNVVQYQNPVASFAKSDSLFCANKIKPITFINHSTSIDTIVYDEWDFGALNVLDTHRIVKHLFKQANLYMVILKVRTNKGCVDDTFQLVEIKKAPQANFTMNLTDSCLSSNKVNFTNTTVIDSAVHQRYKWHFSDSFVLSNADPVGPYTFKLAGKTYAELIYENYNGCIDTMKKYLTIYAPPLPAFNFKSNFSCTNDSIRIANKTTSLYKPVKNNWDFGDGKKDTATNPVHYYNKKGTYKVKLIASIPQGCKDSITQPITVYGSPKADFKINKDNQCLIDNRFTGINTSTTDTGNFPLIKWTYSDGASELNKDTIYKTFASAGDQTIQLKVTGIFGCSDSIIKTVHVKNAPSAQFSINTISQCFKSQKFTFNYIPQTGNDSIKSKAWYYFEDSMKNVNTVSNIKFPYVGSYTVKLKLQSKYGCDGESTQKVFVNENPVARMKVPKPLQCLNGNVYSPVQYSTVSKSTITGFNWDFGDLSSSLVEFPSKTYGKSGSFKILLTVTTDSGCTDTVSTIVKVRASAIITINPVPQVCLNDTVSLNGSATITDGFIRKYQWEFGDNAKTDTIVSPAVRHLYQNVGSYFVKLSTISNYGCVDSKTEYNWVTVNALPNAAFGYDIHDGGQHNSIVNFKDLTQPPAFSLRWNFGKYGTSRKSDTALSIIDTTTIHAKLYVTDSKGCTGMIEKIIFVAPPGEMYFPTAFTANGDGINDGFGPVGIAFATNYKFTIYNRWGEMVYKSTKLGETWDGYYDGSLSQNGVYIYKLELNDFYGQFKSYEGSFLLLW